MSHSRHRRLEPFKGFMTTGKPYFFTTSCTCRMNSNGQMARLVKEDCVCVCGSCVYAGRKQEGPTVNVIGDLAGVSDCEGEAPRKIVNFSLWRDGRSYQRKQTDLKVHAIIINDLAPTSSMLYDVACTSCSPVAGSQMPFFVTYFAVKGLPGLRNT